MCPRQTRDDISKRMLYDLLEYDYVEVVDGIVVVTETVTISMLPTSLTMKHGVANSMVPLVSKDCGLLRSFVGITIGRNRAVIGKIPYRVTSGSDI